LSSNYKLSYIVRLLTLVISTFEVKHDMVISYWLTI